MSQQKIKISKDVLRLKSFVYWIGKALSELQDMTPETRQMMGEAMSEINIPQINDLASLETALKLMSLKEPDNAHSENR